MWNSERFWTTSADFHSPTSILDNENVSEVGFDVAFHSSFLDDQTRVILQDKEDSDYINATMIEVIDVCMDRKK